MTKPMEAAFERAGRAWTNSTGSDTPAFVAEFRRRLAEGHAPAPVVVVHPRRTVLRYALAAAAVIALAMVLRVSGVWGNRIGVIAFRDGAVSGEKDLSRGAAIATKSDAGALMALDGKRILAYLGPDSSMAPESAQQVRLAQGALWCDVKPNSGRFEVLTTYGTVRVHGTSFGVEHLGDRIRVSVESGRVEVIGSRGSLMVDAGMAAELTTGGDPARAAAGTPAKRPAWADGLRKKAASAAAAQYYPSGNLR